jgi:hypothetical protein
MWLREKGTGCPTLKAASAHREKQREIADTHCLEHGALTID